MSAGVNGTLIGRTDKADFPSLGLKRIRVKIDTGAFTSAIHCCRIVETPDALNVIFLDPGEKKYTGKTHKFKKYSKTTVKSSNGECEDRYMITTKICFHRHIYKIDFTLTFRGDMRYPVLIGRKFLAENNFLVNPRLKNFHHAQYFGDKISSRD